VNTIQPLQWVPVNSTTDLSAGVSGWSPGNWFEFIASASSPIVIAGIKIGDGLAVANAQWEVDIGIGLALHEVVIGTVRFCSNNTGNGGPSTYLLPTQLGPFPIGSRVTLRARNTIGTFDVALGYYYDFDGGTATLSILKTAPEHANGVIVTATGVPWGNTNWYPILPAQGTDSAIMAICPNIGGVYSSAQIEYDLGIASSNTVLTTVRGGLSACGAYRIQYLNLPALLPVPSGTPISIRMRRSDTYMAVSPEVGLMYFASFILPPSTPSNYSGIYWIHPGKRNDTLYYSIYYVNYVYSPTVYTQVVKIPDPFVVI